MRRKNLESLINREYVLEILKKHKKDFKEKYGVTAIGLFGSMARGNNSSSSDIDVIIKMSKPDLFYMVHIKEELEAEYMTKVDLIHYRDRMNPFLKKRIDRDAVYV